jgi:hypothetical protein
VAALLTERYGETVQALGLESTQRLMEVWASAETGTWTITVTTAEGATCLVVHGERWDGDPAPLPVGDPA